jgi:NAD(P)-dependent dehydrogenase (short-subunit alcohol dehydrogenase family)
MAAGKLDGKVAVITGAASGIGRACVLRFLEEGARVVAVDIRAVPLEATVTEAKTRGEVASLCGDVTQPAVNEQIVASAREHFDGLDIFFANAGGAMPGEPSEKSYEAYRADVALNLDAFWLGAQAALPVMTAQGSGVLLATASGAGQGAVPGLAPYGAAKAGGIALVRSLAAEYGPLGIRANSISPGPMEAEGILSHFATLPGGRAAYEEQLPLRRMGLPEEIAGAAVFLASDDASYVTGICLPVDGGISARLWQPVLG